MSRLVVVSHTPHYKQKGCWYGWGPTVRELDALAEAFDEIVHICFAYQGPPPAAALPYHSENLKLTPVQPSGGKTLVKKMTVLAKWPRYALALLREFPRADVVHIRAPANISLLAMVLLAFVQRPTKRWIKYAGNWRPDGPEPFSYRFQRWWLTQNFARAKVTVNGRWPGQPTHVVTFPNPCLSLEEWQQARVQVLQKRLEEPVQLLFAGALTANKRPDVVLQALAVLRHRGIEARLTVAGEGSERASLENMARTMAIENHVEFLGFLPRPSLNEHYRRAQFVLLPSVSEGWPKVLSEGMAYGAVPIASAVSSIPQVLAEAGCGRAIASIEPRAYAEAILEYLEEPERWRREVEAGCAYAERFTYESHIQRVRELLGLNGQSSH